MRRTRMLLSTVAAVAVLATACGTSDDSATDVTDDTTDVTDDAAEETTTTAADTTDTTGAADDSDPSLQGDGRELVMFGCTESNVYCANQIAGARAAAEELGFELTVFQNNFSQPEQDQQVQQYLASGAQPAAIIWWPWIADAAVNSTRLLADLAPVIQITQEPNEQIEPFVVAYSGANQCLIGTTQGEMLLEAREAARDAGADLGTPEGNLFVIQFSEAELTGIERYRCFEEVTADEPFNVIGIEYGANSPETGYEVGSQVIPRIRDDVDFLYVSNQQAANGVIRALRENNIVPGEDVLIVSGDCSGSLEALYDGETFGTGIQPAAVEGRLAVWTAARYLAHGATAGDVEQLEVTAEIPPIPDGPPAFRTFMPHAPAIGADGVAATVVWGDSADVICAS